MKKIKQIIALFFTIIFSLGMLTNSVFAETAASNLKIYSNTDNNIPLSFPQNFHVKKTSNGKYVYCLTYAKKSPYGGVNFTQSSLITDNGINYILNNAEKEVSNTYSYFIYQTALWLYIQDKGLASYSYSINTFNNTVKYSSKDAATKIKTIVANAKRAGANDTTKPTLSLSISNNELKLSGNSYVSEGIKITSNVTLNEKDITLSGAPTGSTAKIKNGYIYITVPKNKVTKLKTSITVNAKVSKTIYKSYNYTPSNSAYQKMSATYKETLTKNAKITVKITRTASVKVNKIDAETKKNIAGATLVVKDSNGKKIATWKSTKKAYNLTGLKEGTYTLSETKTPDGYILDKTSITFKVDANGNIKNSKNKKVTSISYSNKKNTINISKQDITTSKELPGATLVLKDSKGTIKDSWTSTKKVHVVRGLKKGTYTLSETIAPDGYKKTTTTVKFTIDEYGKLTDKNGKAINKVVMYNEVTKVNISKQDITTSKELPGAKLVLKDSKGIVKDSWTSTKKVHTITGLSKGKYTLSETIAPDGYKQSTTTIEFNLDEYGKLTDKNGKAIDKVVMFNEVIKINISKQDITTNKELPGATLEVKDSKGTIIDSWTSTSEVHTITGIKAGTYTLEETITPDGYVETKEKISFTIDKYGKIIDKNDQIIDKVVMYNTPEKPKEVSISKQDITTSKELPGATLEVKDLDGNIIDSWTSTEEVHTITGLKVGTYTLTETIAPDGYKQSTTTIKFTINKDGTTSDENGKTIDKVVMTNELNKVIISKQDIANKKELPGASLEIIDEEGNVIDSWISEEKEHTITGLKAGTYTLRETNAPDGYVISDEHITFSIDKYGKIADEKDKEIKKVVMFNEKEEEKSIEVSKQDLATKKELPGASLSLIGENNTIIDTWVSSEETHIVKGIKPGTYTLKETKAPKGYKLSTETITFNVDSEGNITDTNGNKLNKVVMFNEKEEKPVTISKQDITTSKELPGATLEVKDLDGNVIDSWTSSTEPHQIKNLKEGTYTLEETIAPDGYKQSTTTIKFTINKDGIISDEKGKTIDKVVMTNELNKVVISKQDIANKKELPGASLEIIDEEGNVIDSWISEEKEHTITGLKVGKYTLKETNAPDGYVISSEYVTFSIDKYGKVTDKNDKEIKKVVMFNEKEKVISIEVSKQDIATKKELPGASLSIIGENNTIIDTWVSSEETHIVKGIEPGTYTLKETKAPKGYKLSNESITFNVDSEGNITDPNGNKLNKVVMFNEKEEKPVTISKQDITTSKELPGATLVVKDIDGNIIDSWTSTDKPHQIKNLKEGTYTLTETIAPDGYKLSTETITFNVDSNNTLVDKDGNEQEKVIMYNEPIKKIDVTISKQDITTSKELPGATLEVKDIDGNIIDSWTSSTEPHIIKDLPEGTYTLKETIAPDGYILSTETITFTINEKGNLINKDGKNIDKVVMYNEKEIVPTQIPIVKIDAKTKENLEGATLEVKDSEGNIIDTFVTTKEAHYLTLTEGTYTVEEIKAPDGYILNENKITFIVTSDNKITDKDGKELNTIIVENNKKEIITKVSVSKQDITNGNEVPGAKLVVKDKDGNIIDTWISGTEPHLIEGLKPGEYTLNELIAPDGYILSDETITFTVTENGIETKVIMYNAPKPKPQEEKPKEEGEIIKVENTSSKENIGLTIIGSITVLLGGVRLIKRKEF